MNFSQKQQGQYSFNGKFANLTILIILGVNIAVQGIVALFAWINERTIRGFSSYYEAYLPLTTYVPPLLEMVVLWHFIRKLPRSVLTDTSPRGMCWVIGKSQNVLKGLCIGICLAIAVHFLVNFDRLKDSINAHVGLSLVARGIGYKFLFNLYTLVLAPVTEELIFRGVIFGGYAVSIGMWRSGIVTTSLFILCHPSQLFGSVSSAFFLICISVLLLWTRLKWKSIGPAISLHFGFNAVLNIFSFLIG